MEKVPVRQIHWHQCYVFRSGIPYISHSLHRPLVMLLLGFYQGKRLQEGEILYIQF